MTRGRLWNLHRAGAQPDWELVMPSQRTAWQRLAARTHGLATPASLITLGGAVISLVGLWQIAHGSVFSGGIWLIAGRLADAMDGFVADRTGTKSRLGGAFDAGSDKVVAFGALVVLVLHGLLPLWLAALIAFQNSLNVVVALAALRGGASLQPSREGKLAAAGYWLGLTLFVVHAFVPDASLVWAAYMITLLALAVGLGASVGYYDTLQGSKLDRGQRVTFTRYVILRNPASSDAHKARERIHALRRLLPRKEFIVLKTPSSGQAGIARLLRRHADLLGPNTLLCIAAGDGTVSLVVQALLHDSELPDEVRATPVLPLWCGNANDLAYMLNGAWSKRRLKRILNRGHVVRIRPMGCTLTDARGHTSVRTAACYTSFGATAYASEAIERTLPRKSPIRRFGFSRIGQEVIAASLALALAPTFRVVVDGHLRRMYERLYINGSRFAKIIGVPLRLTDAKFHRGIIEQKHPVAVLMHILGFINQREVARRATTHDAFTLEDPVWAQFDGEPVRLRRHTTVSIAISDQPFYALSLRLK